MQFGDQTVLMIRFSKLYDEFSFKVIYDQLMYN